MATVPAQSYLPQLSLAERDRRYTAVRSAMEQQGFDVLLAPAHSGRWEQLQGDARYLSQIGGNATETYVILPLAGEPCALVMNRAAWWRKQHDWIDDVRDCSNRWASKVGDWITERGKEKARFGVAGLAGLSRAADGTSVYGTIQGLKERFPEARFENATDLMLTVRTRKSTEEIRFLEKSAELVALGIQTMVETAAPGVPECEVYGAMLHTMMGHGGELPALFFLSGGPNLAGSAFVPTTRPLETGDVILNEIEIKYGGYGAQSNQPVFVGQPTARQKEQYALGLSTFNAVLDKMGPGVPMGALMDTYTEILDASPFEGGFPLMHARGLGDDRPLLLGGSDLERYRGLPLEEGMSFVLKPNVRDPDTRGRLTIGDTVCVTADGARRLSNRSMAMVVK